MSGLMLYGEQRWGAKAKFGVSEKVAVRGKSNIFIALLFIIHKFPLCFHSFKKVIPTANIVL